MRIHSLVVIILLSSCAIQVKTVQKPNIDFSKLQSWCWLQGCEVVYQGPDQYYDQKVIDEIANAIAWNMYDKGYQQGDDQSDLMLNFYLVLEQDSTLSRERYYGTFQDEREWLPVLYPEYQHFLKGSLVIDAIQRETSELVWTSKAIRYIEVNPTYDKDMIWRGVGKAMKKFPSIAEEP